MTLLEAANRDSIPTTASGILEAARALVPRLQERSDEIEQTRRLPFDVVDALRSTGVFRAGFSAAQGGPGLTSAEQVEIVEALSYANAAAGWCAMIGMDSGVYAGYLDDTVVREMFPTLDLVTAGMLAPVGRADRVPGGFRLSGRWSFASGVTHADWVSAGARTWTDGEMDRIDGSPHWRVLMVPPGDVELVDNWHPTGLAGSGSLDYTISDVFVPAERTFSFADPRCTTGPLSPPDLQMRKMPGVPLGAARAALDHVRRIADDMSCRATGDGWPDSYRVQTELGECEADFRSARYAVLRSLRRRWDRLMPDRTLDDLTSDERIESMLTRAYAFRAARSIVRRLYDLLATTAVYARSPLERALRDTETMCQHTVAQDQILQSAGAHLVGGVPRFPLALGIVT